MYSSDALPAQTGLNTTLYQSPARFLVDAATRSVAGTWHISNPVRLPSRRFGCILGFLSDRVNGGKLVQTEGAACNLG